mmetsp:Transcript_47679/g.102098  ORF Transcript_47679/g.102098 Transcript_47679/m.102098 type:complete len:92 (+) Transcript_47679:1761-2036(+)
MVVSKSVLAASSHTAWEMVGKVGNGSEGSDGSSGDALHTVRSDLEVLRHGCLDGPVRTTPKPSQVLKMRIARKERNKVSIAILRCRLQLER